MKRAALTLIPILSLIFLGVAGTQVVKVAKANFVPTSPANDPPRITIISPTNTTYENEALLHINITVRYHRSQRIHYASYTLDNQEHVILDNNYGETALNWSTTLEGLSEGTHTLQVSASLRSSYSSKSSRGGLQYRTYWGYSDVISFTVVYPPQISVFSIENKTYDSIEMPLRFNLNQHVSWMAYCLDNQANTTIAGNTTLSELSDGSHSLVVYANDTAGNVGASETVTFTIDTPEPFPTTEVAVAVTIASLSAGLLVYIKKRKH